MAYNVYSLPDCKSVLYHPDVGTANLHQCGMGKIVVSAAGDLTSHTTTADGYIVVNKLKTTNGTITLEVPQNSIGDDFLRRWARWARSTASPNRIALGTLTIYDAVAGFTVICTGVSLQKVPDRTFDRTGTNLTYTLLATTIYPSAVVVWDVRSPAADTTIFPIPHWCRLAVPTSGWYRTDLQSGRE